jgi:hypothetical protein
LITGVEAQSGACFGKKRPGRPISTFLLHHDNASAHTAADTRLEMSLMDLESVPHPASSPDLAPMDFAVFPEVTLTFNLNFKQNLTFTLF